MASKPVNGGDERLPLANSKHRSPAEIPLGFGGAGRTVQRLSPDSRKPADEASPIVGRCGLGKTMLVNAMLSGGRTVGACVIDSAGHYTPGRSWEAR